MQPAPQIKSPLSLKTISLVINLILALFIAMLMITKNNDDQIISDQKAKIEAQQATINSLQKATTK